MAVEDILLELIDDNPYNPRKHYPQTKVKEMAQSLRELGLRQTPEGRETDGRVQLAYGHMRLKGFRYNQKYNGSRWGTMPVNVQEISDQDMLHYAMEENLRRTDVTPIEVARCIENFSEMFPDVLDEEIAKKHSMTAANVSNMKRVLRLPEKTLEKLDAGVISFTQGRELLTLEGLENAENLMASALSGLRTGNKAYGHANTVEGLQASIHEIISRHYRPLDKEWEGYSWPLLFDTREAGCLKCDKMIRTHPKKSQAAHYCTDGECWDRHDKEHREKAAAVAKAQMEADILSRTTIAEPISGKMETYRIQNLVTRKWWDGEAASLDAACNAAGWKKEDCWVRVETKRGGWSKRFGHMPTTPPPADISQEMLDESQAVPATNEKPKRKGMTVVLDADGIALPVPCESCAKAETCDRSYFHSATDGSGRLVCEEKIRRPPEVLKIPTREIPEDILTLAKEKAGTRAEVLDLRPLYADDWRHELKGGFVNLSDCINQIDDPAECLERCTRGFHYTFDSKFIDRAPGAVCTDPKCVSQKKAALTRKRNAAGQARKKAEVKAVKETVTQTTMLDRPRIKLILLAQMDGLHASRAYYYGTEGGVKKPEKWLWDWLSAGTPENDRTRGKLFKAIDKLTDEEVAKLVVEFMFYYLTDKGDIGTYEIKANEPLKWMGIEIQEESSNG